MLMAGQAQEADFATLIMIASVLLFYNCTEQWGILHTVQPAFRHRNICFLRNMQPKVLLGMQWNIGTVADSRLQM